MNGATIIVLLGCGVIVSATFPRHRSQNINTNENTNILEDNPTSVDDVENWGPSEGPDQTLDEMQFDADSPITSRVLAASEAAREIMEKYSHQCTNRATTLVVETILNILTNRDSKKNRRNYNVNTNTNTNILGGGRDYERDSRGRQDLIHEKEPVRESLDDFVDLVNNKRTGLFDLDLDSHQGYVIGSAQFGPYRVDPIDRQRLRSVSTKSPEDSKHPDEVMLEKILETIREDAKAETLSESPSTELVPEEPWVVSSLLRKNRNIDRRSPYDAYRTPNLRSSPRYDNTNSNTNSNINSFRRNVNSNSNSNYNTNNYRRNLNSNTNVNTNDNRFGQRYQPRRY